MFLQENVVRIVDLSLTLDEALPGTWPGQKTYKHVLWKDFPNEVCSTYWFRMDEHCGTHCDAPAHFIVSSSEEERDANSGDKLDLSQMQGPLAVFDVRQLCNHGHAGIGALIEPDVIEAWEHQYSPLNPKDICVFQTGWDTYYQKGTAGYQYLDGPVLKKDTFGWPTPSVDTIKLLFEKGIRCIGIDAPSIGSVQNGVDQHRFGLKKKMIYIEGLAQLDKVPVAGAHFIFLPLKISLSTGCPGRAIAIV